MPMSRDEYEERLSKLNNPELTHTERTELLQELRADYSGVLDDHQAFESNISKLEKDNQDLLMSNSKLFRSLSIEDKSEDNKKNDREFEETVTLTQLLEGK